MQRDPRIRNEAHLNFIRSLPCCICGNNIETEAAHIRMADRTIAKDMTGIATKPHDYFTVPLCGRHHREQHDTGDERHWWASKGLDGLKIALRLYSVSSDYEMGCRVVQATQAA